MFKPHELGKRGEDLAVELLQAKGCEILARNWRTGRMELDIIATDGKFLIIAEVKTRSSEDFGSGDENVPDSKMEAMADAGAVFQEEMGMDLEFRFDLISVVFRKDVLVRVDHLEDAFHL